MNCFIVASVDLSEKSLGSKFWIMFVCCPVCEYSDLVFPRETCC